MLSSIKFQSKFRSFCGVKIKEGILKQWWRCTTYNQSPQNIAMANVHDIFIICFVLSCVGNIISDLPEIEKNPEKTMGPSSFETIEGGEGVNKSLKNYLFHFGISVHSQHVWSPVCSPVPREFHWPWPNRLTMPPPSPSPFLELIIIVIVGIGLSPRQGQWCGANQNKL